MKTDSLTRENLQRMGSIFQTTNTEAPALFTKPASPVSSVSSPLMLSKCLQDKNGIRIKMETTLEKARGAPEEDNMYKQ